MKNLKNKNVLVYGLSLSGIWASKLLQKLKANIFLFDDNKEKLTNVGVKKSTILSSVDENLIKNIDLLILSPSIEQDNAIVQLALKFHVRVMSELEFASQFCKKLVAVTGTNGKTTTVELITAMLNKKHKAVACGNIGYPFSKAVMNNKKAIKVAEVSSFMLENAKTLNPKVATILNIEPDHLIRHKTMEEYTALKLSILKNQRTTDYVVVNRDINLSLNTPAQAITYSYSHHADVRVKDGSIYLFDEKVIDLNQIPLKGKHNIYNIMCAICYAYIYGVKTAQIKSAILEFNPAKFRNEFILKSNGIKFVNDSKSTNISSTLAAAEATKGAIILLVGGSNKNLDYSTLFEKLPKRVKHVVAFGEIAEEMAKANNGKFLLDTCQNLSSAFDFAISVAKPNDTVLLSPASASYDEFTNYIERGNKFNEKVKEYANKNTQT